MPTDNKTPLVRAKETAVGILRYSQVTKEQLSLFANGCGGKGSWIPIPEFIFHASCNQHDFYYWRGGTEEDRKIADDAFYKYMKEDIKRAKWYLRGYYRGWAFLYYTAVRVKGKYYFSYGEMKTMEDVIELELKQKGIIIL